MSDTTSKITNPYVLHTIRTKGAWFIERGRGSYYKRDALNDQGEKP